MGSDEGGLDELVELSLRRASRSLMRCSSSTTRLVTESQTARMAAWASGGTVFQSDSAMGGLDIIPRILRHYCTKSSTRERVLSRNGPSVMNMLVSGDSTLGMGASAIGAAIRFTLTVLSAIFLPEA